MINRRELDKMNLPFVENKAVHIVIRVVAASVCVYATFTALWGPTGFSDKTHYIIVPFGLATTIAVFLPRLGVLRVHAVWCLLLAVVAQQAYRKLEYEKFRADGNYHAAMEMTQELEQQRQANASNVKDAPKSAVKRIESGEPIRGGR